MGYAKGQVKPFIKWVGGKTQLISSIEKAIPSELYHVSNLTYVEPFVGGGAMLFWALSNLNNIQKAVINDINKDLTTAYKTVRDEVDTLVKDLKQIEKEYKALPSEESRKEYYMIKRALFNTKQLESVENTALFIFLNRTCFNGLYRVNSRGLFNVPFGKYANPTICDERTLFSDSELLQKVEILTGDFAQTLDYANENAFFYLDPPYKPISATSSFTAYAKDTFNDDEQIRLKEFCDTLDTNECFWILSNSDVKSLDPTNDFFDDLYAQYKINRVLASRSINANAEKRGKLKELLISN
ncbi:MAG: DNA adenine methylase [Bacteroidales bacterium]